MAPGKLTGITPYLCFLVGITVLGPLQFGYHIAELNNPSEAIQCQTPSNSRKLLEYFRHGSNKEATEHGLPVCLPMTPSEFGLVSSIYTLGGFIGALCAGPISSRRGRLSPMRLTFPFFVLGALMEALAPSIPVMALGRLASGVGAGAAIVVGPIYISEIAPSGMKGTLGALTQVATNVGILIAQVLGYFLSYGSMWRVVLGAGGVLALLHFVGLLAGVESPEWLGSKGMSVQAKRALHKIRSGTLTEEEVRRWGSVGDDEERSSLLPPSPSSTKSSRRETPTVGMFSALRHPEHNRAIVAVIAVMVAQQFTGINSVIMYSVTFLKTLLPTSAPLVTIAVGGLNLVVTVLCAPLADRLGRKPCLLLSIAGMGSMSVLIGAGMMRGVPVLVSIATLLFVCSFAVGLGPVPFILASELVPPEAVGATQSWALASNWLATFVVVQFFPMLNEQLEKGRVFFIFAALAVVFFVFISWWVPESKGKVSADEVWGRVERRED